MVPLFDLLTLMWCPDHQNFRLKTPKFKVSLPTHVYRPRTDSPASGSFTGPVTVSWSPTHRSPTRWSPTHRSPTRRSPTPWSPTRRSPTRRSPTRRSPTCRSPTPWSLTHWSPTRRSPTHRNPTRRRVEGKVVSPVIACVPV